jgi:hypothetical protein
MAVEKRAVGEEGRKKRKVQEKKKKVGLWTTGAP